MSVGATEAHRRYDAVEVPTSRSPSEPAPCAPSYGTPQRIANHALGTSRHRYRFRASARPDASNLNVLPLQTVANAVTVAVGPTGRLYFFSTATTHLIVDVEAGYPTARVGELFWMNPTRMFDSRAQNAKVIGGTVVELVVAGAYGVPANAIAVALSVTIDSPNSDGYVTVYPCGASIPDTWNVKFVTGQTVANFVLATVGVNGKVCLLVTGTAHLIVDVNAAYVS